MSAQDHSPPEKLSALVRLGAAGVVDGEESAMILAQCRVVLRRLKKIRQEAGGAANVLLACHADVDRLSRITLLCDPLTSSHISSRVGNLGEEMGAARDHLKIFMDGLEAQIENLSAVQANASDVDEIRLILLGQRQGSDGPFFP